MGKNKNEITMVCEDCGALPPIDNERSNENWTIYITKDRCECGGKFDIDFGNLN